MFPACPADAIFLRTFHHGLPIRHVLCYTLAHEGYAPRVKLLSSADNFNRCGFFTLPHFIQLSKKYCNPTPSFLFSRLAHKHTYPLDIPDILLKAEIRTIANCSAKRWSFLIHCTNRAAFTWMPQHCLCIVAEPAQHHLSLLLVCCVSAPFLTQVSAMSYSSPSVAL